MTIEVAAHGWEETNGEGRKEREEWEGESLQAGGWHCRVSSLVKERTNKKGLYLESRQRSIVVQIGLFRNTILYTLWDKMQGPFQLQSRYATSDRQSTVRTVERPLRPQTCFRDRDAVGVF